MSRSAAQGAAPDDIDAIRGFNRFYTRQLGLLDQGLLGSEFTLTEVRVLYELANRDSPLASDLAADLLLDFGYLSRILKKFEKRGLLRRARLPSDARQSALSLSASGRKAFAGLNEAARRQVAEWIKPLSGRERSDLVDAMRTVLTSLESSEPKSPVTLRDLASGDIGWIVHRQALLYREEYGWDMTYESLIAEIAGKFVTEFKPDRERAWVAEQDSRILGAVFLVHASDGLAKLRLLYVEPAARGQGIGRRLVDACIQFARDKGYKTLTLWTNDVLASARRIYIAAGFKLTHEVSNRQFGKDLVSQTWDLAL